MPTVLRPDPFSVTLLESESLVLSEEQRMYIREILETGASDSKFAQKMYDAIYYVLTHGTDTAAIPEVTSLNPSSVTLGSPTFDIHVMGKNFTTNSIIMFAGQPEPTTLVSPTELTTGVNMDVWAGPDIVQVYVETDGVASDPLPFEFLPASGVMSAAAGGRVAHAKENEHKHVEPVKHMEAPHTKK